MSDQDNQIEFPDTPFPLQESLVLLCRRGSECHGTFIPSNNENGIDDRDLMGVCIPPEKYYLGLKKFEHTESIKGVWDVVIYEFRKYVGLLMNSNPNVVGSLWLEEEDYLLVTNIGRRLIENRELFKHRGHAYNSFLGYAKSQFKKMKIGVFNGYMGEKRKKIVEKYSFDIKNAAHMVRLLHMGIEYLTTGEMKVRRTWDRDMLIDIKTGKWTFDQVQDYAKSKFSDIDLAYKNSCLPTEMDIAAIESLVIDCLKSRIIK